MRAMQEKEKSTIIHRLRSIFKGVFLTLIWMGVFLPLFAQVPAPSESNSSLPLKFAHYSSKNGLPQNSVLAIFQDKTGFIWMGTDDGLARFDGYQFQVFRHQPGNSSSIHNNVIRAIIADPSGNLWIGTEGGGISIFDPKNEVFFNLATLSRTTQELSTSKVSSLLIDDQSQIWVGTNGSGLFRISLDFSRLNSPDSYQGKIEVHQFNKGNSELLDDKIWSLYQDKKGNLWIGTLEGGVYTISAGENNPKKVELQYKGLRVSSVKSFYEDQHGDFWIGTERQGLFHRPSGQTEFRQFSLPEKRKSFQQQELNVTSIQEDLQGNLWIGTLGRGLYILNPKTIEIFHFEDDPSDPYSLNGNSVFTQFRDRAGNIWLGMYSGEGLNKVSPSQQQFEHFRYDPDLQRGLSGKMVKTIFKDRSGNLWIGLFNGGLNLLPASSSRFTYFSADGRGFLSHNHVQSIFQRSNGDIWIGTDGGGITVYNPETGKASYLKSDPSHKHTLSKNEVWAMVEDKNGKIWIGTANGGGLNQYDPQTGTVQHFVHQPGQPNSILFNDVRALLADSKNNLWIGTYGGGLSRMDLKGGNFQHFVHGNSSYPKLSHNIITSILEDKKGFIWVGTFGGGLQRINPLTDSVQVFREKDGLPSDIVKAILEDNQGQLWISTVNGLSALDPISLTFRNYKEEDGLQSEEFNLGSAFKDTDGKLFFGGINGFNAFFPDRIEPYPTPKAPIITGLKVLNQKVIPGEQSDQKVTLNRSVTFLEEIQLESDQNSFEFEFSSLEYLSQEKIHFEYQLIGYDGSWIRTSSQRRFANYANLPPGTYQFKIRAAYEGDANYSPIREIKVVVHPPWFRSPIAFWIYFILLIGIAYAVKSFVTWRIKLRNDLRFERLEKEKQEEVNQLKLRFFTNISHELRTPLMLIKSPLEQLVQRLDLPRDARRQLDSIHANSARLLRLINQLLDFRKQETGHLKLAVKKVHIRSFLTQIKEAFDVIAEQRNIEFSLNLEENFPDHIWMDPDQMEKVFFNLVFNAFKFTPDQGKIRLRAGLGSFSTEKEIQIHGVCVEVEDNGMGIPSDQLERVFDRFFQVKEQGVSQTSGTGIGLALSKNLVDFHKGQINVRSIPDEKTVFQVCLRLGFDHFEKHELTEEDPSQVEKEWVKTEVARLSLHSGTSSHREKEKKAIPPGVRPMILLVEDNPELLDLLESVMESYFNVLTAANGKEALDRLSNQAVDFIISDVMMPEIDGVELCARVKGSLQLSHIPFILLTAKSSHEHQLHGYEAGADDYIPKPFNLDLLVLKVKNLLDTREKFHLQFKSSPDLGLKLKIGNSSDEKFIKKAIEVVEANLESETFGIQDLVTELGVSRTLLFEKFKSLLGHTPNEFIQTIRLKYAAQLIKNNDLKINEISFKVGYSDPKYFSKIFQKQFGTSPSQFKKS
jgi:signal transduction histidine kinase/ligand-binding sensor domain-containing protein/DNA-binding response OmpR family regulator